MAQATLNKTLEGHTSYVFRVAFSPDSKLIASASADQTVRLWSIPTGELNAELKGHESGVSSVAFSPDGNSIVTGSGDKTVRTWSIATKLQLEIFNGHYNDVYSVAWSPNGALIASGSEDKTVILWDANSGSAKKKLKGHTNSVVSVLFSQNGNKLASAGSHDKTVIVWDVNSGAALINLPHSHTVWFVCFSHDDQFVITGCNDKIVCMFDANTGHEEKRFGGHTDAVYSVAISFDGSMIASGSNDNSVSLWDVASTKQLQQLRGHTKTVNSVAFSRDGKFIASASRDQTVRLWNAPFLSQIPHQPKEQEEEEEETTLHKTLQGHTNTVFRVAFSPDGKIIASASADQTVRLWSFPTGKLNAELKGYGGEVYSVAFSPDGKSIVTGCKDETVRTWSIATKLQLEIFNGHYNDVNSVAWSPCGDVIASCSDDKTVILWDANSGSAKKKLKGHTNYVCYVSFSQNGNKLVSGGYDKTAIIWDVNSGAALIKLAHSSYVLSVCFSPDDQFVVTGCADHILHMFNANNGHEEKRFEGHAAEVSSVAFSFDGSMIASGSGDKSVRLWDVASTKQLQKMHGHTSQVRSVAFSRDGKCIASGSRDKTVRLWNAPLLFQIPHQPKEQEEEEEKEEKVHEEEEEATLHKILQGHTDHVESVAFSPDSKFIASTSADRTVRLRNIPSGNLQAELKWYGGEVLSVAFSPNGKSIVTGSKDKTVQTWSIASKQQLKTLEGHSSSVNSVAWSPNGDVIASGSFDRTVILWDVISGSVKKKLKGHTSYVYSVSFSQNGNQLASAGHDETAIIWDANFGVAIIKLAHSDIVWSVCFSHDDQFVVTGCGDNIVHMFNTNTGHEEKRFEGHTDWVRSVSCSFDGSIIASASDDRSVRLWDVASTKQLQQLDGQKDCVRSVAFSRDGKFIASGSSDNTVRLWNAPSSLRTPTSLLKSACFTGDVDAAKFQLDQGALVNNKDGSTALYAASSKGSKQLVELLIERGADINLRGNNGSTALHAACYQGHLQVIELLTEHGADVKLCNADQHTALHLAYLNDHLNVFVYLMNHGSLVDEKGKDGLTILHWASCQGNQQFIKLLIEHGADVNLRDQDQNTPVFVAFTNGHSEVAKYLLQCGAFVNEKSADGQTMLHQAISSNNVAFAQLLLQWGADINIADDWDRSALQLANQSKSAEIKAAFNQATNLQNKNLKSIPASAFNQTAQFTLRLGNNKFGPDVWDTLTSSSACKQFLVGLFLQSNPSLGIIPGTAAKLGQLSCLSVADCGLASSDIRNLSLFTSLRALDLSNNPLVDISNEFANLKELRHVFVSNCKLSAIPAFISQLPHIVFVDASQNNINRVPVALASNPSLTDLVLYGNPLSSLPSEYHTKPTEELFAYLRDLATESKPVYRSKLLLVGYGGVGKTTLLNALFPPESILERKTGAIMKSWEKRLCKLQGDNFIFYGSQAKNGDWQDPKAVDLINAQIETDDDRGLIITSKGVKHEFRCASVLEREEWLRACKFQAKNAATDGISVICRDIPSKELASALNSSPYIPPTNAPLDQQISNRVPAKSSLQLSAWDFAGQHEYQDGHQMFLTSRAVYLVLWDVTPSKQKSSLAQLRHWLSTLQLQLGKADKNIRSSALLYIVGTHADAPDVDRKGCQIAAERVAKDVSLTVPYRVILPISRTTEDVGRLKQQLLADLAIQQHLGEEVPTSYLDLEIQLRQDQDEFRVKVVQTASKSKRISMNENDIVPPPPMLSRSDLVARLRLESGLVTRALNLFQMWGFIIYLGESHPSLQDLIITAPEWLTVSVLGSLVYIVRVRRARAQSKSETLSSLSVQHSDLITDSAVWRSLGAKQDQVLQILYAFDLGFPADAANTRPFAERFSIFPQLLSPKPPPSFIWDATPAGTPELSRVVELNGVPMGFHTVLLSRLRAQFTDVYLPSCWRSGFVFNSQSASRAILVTIHEDSCRIRFCVRNSNDFGKVFSELIGTDENPGVLRQMISDRYKGVIIAKEYVECICQTCLSRKWKWNKTISTAVSADKSIPDLCNDTAAKSELSQALLAYVQPDGSPHIFPIEVVLSSLESKQTTMLCPDSSLAVSINDLMTISSTMIGSNEEYLRVASEILGLKKQVLEVAGRVDRVEHRLDEYERELAKTTERLFKQLDSFKTQNNSSSSSQIRNNPRLWTYYQMLQEVLNSAYMGAYAVKSNQVPISLGVDPFVKSVEKAGSIIGLGLPGFQAVTSILCSISRHFIEKDQRHRLDRLVLFPNPIEMYQFNSKLALHLAEKQQTKLQSDVKQPTAFGKFLKDVKETLFYQRINSSSSTDEQYCQKIAILDAEVILEYITTTEHSVSALNKTEEQLLTLFTYIVVKDLDRGNIAPDLDKNAASSKNFASWSVDEVCAWLKERSYEPRIIQLFRENEIDGEALGSLDDNDLEKMGVKALGTRKRLLTAIKQLSSI